jgi:hypothetical protein
MNELGLIHISGWRRNTSGAFVIPQYSAGEGQDYSRPKISDETRAAPGMLRLLEVIERHGPLDYRQAAYLAGLAVNTVKNAGYLKALVAQGKIHISAWRRSNRGAPRPIYDSGKGESADRPVRLPPYAKSRAYRLRCAARNGSFIAQIQQLTLMRP